jgi:hypothetical protein
MPWSLRRGVDVTVSGSAGVHPSPAELSAFGSSWLQNVADLDFDLDQNGVANFAKLAAQGGAFIRPTSCLLGVYGPAGK